MNDKRAQRFLISIHQGSQLLELVLPANIEAIEFDQLNEVVATQIAKAPGKKWIVDLTGAEYIGSALLGMLVNIRTKVRALKGTLVLCSLSEDLSRVLRTSSMERLFTVVATRADT